jgi:hypothetical protein
MTKNLFKNKQEADNVMQGLKSLNEDESRSLQKLQESWQRSIQNEKNPYVKQWYEFSLKTLLQFAPYLYQMRRTGTQLATPIVASIEFTLGLLSMLLVGAEALRDKRYRQNVRLRRQFYENMHVLVETLPTISPLNDLETDVDSMKQRLRETLEINLDNSVVQHVETFFDHFKIVDGTSFSGRPHYVVPIPMTTETLEVENKDDIDLRIESMLYPIRVDEFLESQKIALPHVSIRKQLSPMTDTETLLKETIAILDEFNKSVITNTITKNDTIKNDGKSTISVPDSSNPTKIKEEGIRKTIVKKEEAIEKTIDNKPTIRKTDNNTTNSDMESIAIAIALSNSINDTTTSDVESTAIAIALSNPVMAGGSTSTNKNGTDSTPVTKVI